MPKAPTPSFFLSLGAMITVPLKVYPAARPEYADLTNVHPDCPGPGTDPTLMIVKTCKACLTEVKAPVKRFQFDDGECVLLTDEEIKAQGAEKSKNMNVLACVSLDEIEGTWLAGDPSYVGPASIETSRVYTAIYLQLKQASQGLIVTFVAVRSGRDKIGLLRPGPECLILQPLYFPSEMRDFTEQNVVPFKSDLQLADQEKRLLRELLDSWVAPFDPVAEGYRDRYLDNVRALALAKKEGRVLEPAKAPESPTAAVSLVDALQASLAQRPGKDRKPPVAIEKTPEKTDKKKARRSA